MKKMFLEKSSFAMAIFAITISIAMYSCTKNEVVTTSTPVFSIGASVKPGNIGGTIKGTFLADSVYYVTSDVVVNPGDTLYIQGGARIYFLGSYSFFVKGNLLSIGTKDHPIYFTVQNQPKKDAIGQDPTTDPAYKGTWGGIFGDSTTQFMIIKYTHIEFAGGLVAVGQVFGVANGAQAAPVRFVNEKGTFVCEDSWFYGQVDGGAAISIAQGQFHIMRNIFEKSGFSGGECVEFKNGSQGNVAYNLFMGSCTNAIKVSNGKGLLSQVNVIAYNNTIINGGYRRFIYGGAGNSTGRGGSINYEQNGRGEVYNNLIVNCKLGLRITNTFSYDGNNITIADTANMKYSNNYFYGDSTIVTSAFYPKDCLTKPQPTDIPTPSTYLPATYKLGDVYDGTKLNGQNNPQFVNFNLPIVYGSNTVYNYLGTQAFTTAYDFHLKSTSPAIGKGTTSFTLSKAVSKIDPLYGATEITIPGADMGCYQFNGNGLKN